MRGIGFLQLFSACWRLVSKSKAEWWAGGERNRGRKKVGFFVAFHFSEQTCCTSWLSPSWTPPVCPWPQPWKHRDQGGVQPSRQWGSQSTINWLTLNPFLMVGTAVERLLLFFPNSSIFWHSLLFCIRELFSRILGLEIAISLMSSLPQLVCGQSPDINWLKNVSLVFFCTENRKKRFLHMPVS